MNSQNTISAKKSVKQTVRREPKNYDHGFNLNWFLSNSVNMINNLPMTHAFMSELCHMALALVFQLGFPFTVSDI